MNAPRAQAIASAAQSSPWYIGQRTNRNADLANPCAKAGYGKDNYFRIEHLYRRVGKHITLRATIKDLPESPSRRRGLSQPPYRQHRNIVLLPKRLRRLRQVKRRLVAQIVHAVKPKQLA
jgi:hypothetical protein